MAYADPQELNYGITQEELDAVDRTCAYLEKACAYESRQKTRKEWEVISGVTDEGSVNYCVNVASNYFHGARTAEA